MSEPARPSKLWNLNFLLLWQGLFVSSIGDIAYEIALGFWILAVTGSTGLMGGLMAASAIPRVLLAPFAGVLVDRLNRKRLIVGMDAIRGAVVVLVGIAAAAGLARVWMVFAAGIVIGAAAAVFNPSISSVIPDIVPRERLVKGNSFFSMIRAGSGVLGNSLGGILYGLLGAPVMFLINGVSYLFSSTTELFLRIPRVHHERAQMRYWTDMKEGLSFVWRNTGLRFMMAAAGALNFFAWIAIVLILPLFQRTPSLGPERYGLIMAALTVGMLVGMATTAAVKIPEGRRLFVFSVSAVAFIVPMALFPHFTLFPLMLVMVIVAGYFNAIVNVLIQSVIQLAVPQNVRGKVMGLLEALTQGLTPIGMAVGGLLGEVLPLRLVISGGFAMMGVVVIPLLFTSAVREFFAIPATEANSGGEGEA